ncbi:unnamed protein product, partial [Cyprideis torosa]
QFVSKNKFGNESIDFSNPLAVKALNKSLLLHHYNITYWDIPKTNLCPPIPGRADYIHYIADLLSLSNKNLIPMGEDVRGLDIGVGANCIYPIIGHQEYVLVSKKENLKPFYNHLKKVKAFDVKTIEMEQGNKISRFIAWTFLDESQQKNWNKQKVIDI